MANEGTLALNLSASKNGPQFNFRPRTINPLFDIAGMLNGGNYPIHQVFTIGTTDTVIDLENVGTPGFILFFNTSLTSDIKLGADGSSYPNFARKGGSGYGLVEWNGAAIHALAVAAPADLEMLILPK